MWSHGTENYIFGGTYDENKMLTKNSFLLPNKRDLSKFGRNKKRGQQTTWSGWKRKTKTLSISMEPKSFKSFYKEGPRRAFTRGKKNNKNLIQYSKYKMFKILHRIRKTQNTKSGCCCWCHDGWKKLKNLCGRKIRFALNAGKGHTRDTKIKCKIV